MNLLNFSPSFVSLEILTGGMSDFYHNLFQRRFAPGIFVEQSFSEEIINDH